MAEEVYIADLIETLGKPDDDPTSLSNYVLVLLLSDIRNTRSDRLDDDLQDLRRLGSDDLKTYIFNSLTNIALVLGWYEGVLILLSSWLQQDDKTSLLFYAVMYGTFDHDTLLRLVHMMGEKVNLVFLIEFAITQTSLDPLMMVETVLDKLWSIYLDKPNEEELKSLIIMADEKKMPHITLFLRERRSSIMKPAPIPEYIIPSKFTESELQDMLTKEAQNVKPLNVKTRADLREFLLSSVIDVLEPEGIKAIEDIVTNMSDEKVSEELDRINRETWVLINENNILFRQVLGPANSDSSIPPLDPDTSDLYANRMLTDETRDFEEGEYHYWFTGECEHCGRPILKACYAVRLPMPSGSWMGCYCSFVCLRDMLSKSVLFDEPMKKTLNRFVDATEKVILEVGILDRDYTEEKLDIEEDISFLEI